MMNLLTAFQQNIREEGLFNPADRLLIAVSGGIDSVVLTHLCHTSGNNISLAHINFCLRGEESNRDENFVRALAVQLSVPVFVKRVDTKKHAAENKISIQESARILRYAWFRALMDDDQHLNYLCTAHHADDNIETVLMNLFRGTGIAGLKGILPKQEKIIRPLLFATRKDIENYAEVNQLSHVEDSSNSEEKYTRNFFRLQVIPMVEKIYPSVTANMRQNIERFRETEEIYRAAIQIKINKLLQQKNEEWDIPVEKLRLEKPLRTLIFELFSRFGFTAAQKGEIISLMDSSTGRFIQSPTHRLLKNRNWFIITPIRDIDLEYSVIVGPADEEHFSDGIIEFSVKEAVPGLVFENDKNAASLDTNAIEYPIVIRRWKTGDYFYPLGMRKKKKVSRFLIDCKMPQHEKDNVRVMESGGRIIWLIGHRIDDRCKVGPQTRHITTMRWKKSTQ